MIYKICIIKNRYTGTLNIQKYVVDWFTQNTPLNIITDYITTDFDVTTFKASNATLSGVICGADILPKIRTVVPEGKYNAVVFLYGNNLNGIRVSSTNIMGQDPLYPDTEFIQTWQGLDEGKTINHELFHAFFFKAHKLQINIVDNMDTYLNNNDMLVDWIPNTNREIALNSLKPYWAQICAFRNTMPTVTINRISDDGTETLGNLIYDNFRCKTLERPWKNNLPNISCIPKGTYDALWTFSFSMIKYTYELQNVPGRSGIRIHAANYYDELKGCIALGATLKDINGDGELDATSSTITINAFNKLVAKKPIKVIIQ